MGRGDELVLEGRQWWCRLPHMAMGKPFHRRSIDGRELPIGCVELLVAMQMKWGYHKQDKDIINELKTQCEPALMDSILIRVKYDAHKVDMAQRVRFWQHS